MGTRLGTNHGYFSGHYPFNQTARKTQRGEEGGRREGEQEWEGWRKRKRERGVREKREGKVSNRKKVLTIQTL